MHHQFQRLSLPRFMVAWVVSSVFSIALGQDSSKVTPQWIWVGESKAKQSVWIRREFTIDSEIANATVRASADNHCEVFINGRKCLSSDRWETVSNAAIESDVRQGVNLIAIKATNDGGLAGLIASVHVDLKDGKSIDIVTDASWQGSIDAQRDWQQPDFDDAQWVAPKILGELGNSKLPWSKAINTKQFDLPPKTNSSNEFMPVVAEHAHVPDGFKIEEVFQVPREMGSWVSLTTDPTGRLIASDQGSAGLFMITPGDTTKPTKVEKLPVELSGAHGLLWAFDSLYAVVNGGKTSGLHRLTDTDGDGRVDSDEHCMDVPGSGEHGPHAVVLSPDGKSLYVASGNHTKLPKSIAGSRIPQNWNEDHLLPRRWDANGHAAGILAPGGWICNVDPSGKEWNVFSIGYRNEYDIAFNSDGELFTFDADMEWDFGSPWYRPTRVCHVTSGSEFGWRSGTGKWPAYYEDSLPPVIDIGPGSPTGVVFGTGTKFPAKFQKALFILDWTYSTIYSVQLTPDGSSYRGEKADFVTGSPLPVTDAVVGLDGALYFTAGGRGTESSLYRVTYVGTDSTEAVEGTNPAGRELRTIRHQLERWHGQSDGDLDEIIRYLSHEDRFIRYAARIALESQPIEKWRARVFGEKKPSSLINAMLAVARQGTPEDLPKIIEALTYLDFQSLSETEKLGWLRTLEVAFARQGEPSDIDRKKLLERLNKLYPSKQYAQDAELVQLLVYLKSPTVVAKTIALMQQLGPEPIPDWGDLVSRNSRYGGTVGKMLADMPPVRAIHFAFILRNAKSGWTIEERKQYFGFFIAAAKHPGGNSFAKFLMQFRDDAIATCSPAEQLLLESLTSQSLVAAPVASTPPKGPGRVWSREEALDSIGKELTNRNFAKGHNLFHATSCSKCHRLGGEGGAVGPDLSTAAKKFSISDMLDAIIEPSKAISDQYGSHQILTDSGTVLVGRAVEIGDEYYVYTVDANAKPTILRKNEVEEITPSKISQMPAGLIDTLNEEELKDLIAFLMASGDPKAKVFK
ncbi:MAG: c-type cytochrome [Pirellulaceae bacterium]|nr:c-type cytochrome [Pirellulaceae bacterium]